MQLMDTNKANGDDRGTPRPWRPAGPGRPRARAIGPAFAALAAAGLLGGCGAATFSGQQAARQPASRTQAAGTPAPARSAPAQSAPSTGATRAPGGPSSAPSAANCTSTGASVTADRAPASGSAGTDSASTGAARGGAAPSLQAIQFADASHGWAAGNGRILATSDGGHSWIRQYAGPAALYQVDFTDAAHGWAVGKNVLLRTTDGGSTWTAVAEPALGAAGPGAPCQGIDTVHFVSPSIGYAVAGGVAGADAPVLGSLSGPFSGGRLLRSADGGQTWQQLGGTPADPESACFTSVSDGYLGAPGAIWHTRDGGTSWTKSFTEPPAARGASGAIGDTPNVQCAGPDAAWVLFVGQGTAMMHSPYLAYVTKDGGTWRGVMEEPMLESSLRPRLHLRAGPGSEPGPFSVISPDAAAFVGYTPPANGWGAAPLSLAVNGGATLSGTGDIAAINQPLAAAFLSTNQGWVVGENLKTRTFAIEATTDGGHTWTTQYTTG
jgi:photosystem II stability/assembly factor-like uncharacterized protein